MQSYKNLVLIGTSHISKESIALVSKTIKDNKPDVVAIELDEKRMKALLTGDKGELTISVIKEIGFKGYLFGKVGHYVEHKVGKYVGVSPGEEMLKAYHTGIEVKSKIEYIDQNISITLKRFSKEITWKEKWRFFVDILKSPFGKKIKIDLNKVPERGLIKEMLDKVKDRYPNFYKVLVTERNKYMAKKLFVLMKNYTSIVGVVGAGHEKEMIEEIKELEKAN